MDVITRFSGEYDFLSNFFIVPVTYNGVTYQSSEAAFQAQKCLDEAERLRFAYLRPAEAKRLGRKVALRPDWNEVKAQIMYEAVTAKFTQNPELGAKLIATGDAELIEGNTWNDTFWGVSLKTGRGENNLGKILMRVRAELSAAADPR